MRRALILLTALLGLATSARAQQVVARVGGELTAPAYTYLRVPITVDMTASGGQLLGSYTARLTWNPALLSYSGYGFTDSSAQGNFPPPTIRTDSTTQGILKFTAVSPSGASGLVTIAQFRFYGGYDTLPSPLALSFSEMSAAGTFANLLPILTAQGATFCRSRGLWGDLDRDGASNSRDALIVLSKVVGLAVDPQVADTALADVDADGRATSRDALVILSYAVGMPVAGQRVLLPAASPSCATGSARQLALQPAAIELVVGQTMRLLAQATDSAGRTVAVPPTSWRSSDYAVAGVDGEGNVTPRSAGTATITAEVGPGVSATATVTVIARRSTWYVDIAATGRSVQNGSAALPYEGPAGALRWVSEGDTVRIATGTYEWEDWIEVAKGVLILGGTPGDTLTRPVLRGLDENLGLLLAGGQRVELRNVTFRGFETALDVDGVRNLILEDVQFLDGQYGQDGIYMCGNVGLDTLRLDRTVFLGNPASTSRGDAIYIGGCTTLDVKVLLLRDSRIEHMGDAVDGYGVDSMQVLRSVISDNHDAIYLSQEYDETPALHVSQSRVERNRWTGIRVHDARRVVIDTSVIRADSADAVVVNHDNTARGSTILRGDSVYMNRAYENWLQASGGDSIVIQDVVVRFPSDRSAPVYSTLQAGAVSVRRSVFENVGGGSYPPLSVTANRLVVDSVAMSACAVDGCSGAYGVDFSGSGASPWAQVLRSSFTRVDYPVVAYGPGTVLEVREVVADSLVTGVNANNVDSVAVWDSRFTRVMSSGIHLYTASGARGPSAFAGNTVTCTTPSYSQYGVYVYDAPILVQFDTVSACQRGVELNSVRTGSRIRHSTLRDNAIGAVITQYYPQDTVRVAVDSTAVSGSSTSAISLYGLGSFTHNRVENNPGDGLSISWAYGAVVQAHDNALVNNTGYAVAAPSDTVDASANWWGSPAQPGTSPPNGVLGRVNTSSPLASPPPNLPGLAPPSLSRAVGATLGAAAVHVQAAATASRPERRPRPQVVARDTEADRLARREAKRARSRENRTSTSR